MTFILGQISRGTRVTPRHATHKQYAMVVSNIGIAQTNHVSERTVFVSESKQAFKIVIVCVMRRGVVRYVYRFQLVLKHLSHECGMGNDTIGMLSCLFEVIAFPLKAGALDTFCDQTFVRFFPVAAFISI